MGALNTAMNALGTLAALKSLSGSRPPSTNSKYNNFLAEIRANSVARTNLFEVTITPPAILTGSTSTVNKIALYAEGAQLPGLFLQTAELKRFGFGPNEKVPYAIQTNATTINFIGDGKGELYKFFYRWLQGIVRGDYDPSTESVSQNGLTAYEVEFKERYKCQMIITTFNEQGTPVLEYQLTDAFPVNIADVALNWNEGGMMQFSVQFEFLQSKLLKVEEKLQLTNNGFGGLSKIQKLAKIGTAVQTVLSLKRPSGVQDALSSVTTIKNVFR